MIRAISPDTTHRRPAMQAHRARPAGTQATTERKGGRITEKDIEYQHRLEYLDFINRLMHRMKMDGIEKMLDLALVLTE